MCWENEEGFEWTGNTGTWHGIAYSVWFLKISLPTPWRATGQGGAWPKISKRKSKAWLRNSQRGGVGWGGVGWGGGSWNQEALLRGVQAWLFSVHSKPPPAALLAFLSQPCLFTEVLFSLNGSSCVCMKIKTAGDILTASTTGYGLSKWVNSSLLFFVHSALKTSGGDTTTALKLFFYHWHLLRIPASSLNMASFFLLYHELCLLTGCPHAHTRKNK